MSLVLDSFCDFLTCIFLLLPYPGFFFITEIPSDSHYISPFHPNRDPSRPKQYMTFEPDGGGWNNIRFVKYHIVVVLLICRGLFPSDGFLSSRISSFIVFMFYTHSMAMETVVGLAIATGRILVLPPEQRMYLLAQGRGQVKTDFSFKDFFPFEELANENDGLTMITMKEFLETEWGNLVNKVTGRVEYPPLNRTDWDGQDVKVLKEWLRNVTHTPLWSPSDCMAVFPASGEHKDAVQLEAMLKQIHMQGALLDEYIDNPVPVDGTTLERMRESLSQRRHLCMYDETMQSQFVVHFMCYHKMRVRMLVHFYAFLFFEDWRDDLWMKRCVGIICIDLWSAVLRCAAHRNIFIFDSFCNVFISFMRDHMRYIDELQCAAARIVEEMRERALKDDPDGNGDFDTFHIRRGGVFYVKLYQIGPIDLILIAFLHT